MLLAIGAERSPLRPDGRKKVVLLNKTQRRGEKEGGNPRDQKSAGRMGGNPYDPLTTTNSTQESEMADANTKPRRRKNKPVNMQKRFALVLRNYPDLPKRGWPYLPWMQAIDIDFKIFGFKPGDRIYLNANYVTRQITITPDYGQLALREQPYHDPDWVPPPL
ncbi:HSP20-like protein [Burkholderia cenocepacia]|jgi:hypothetical protein|nr:HSP20-like protein [Burkholderia cenocepacia]SPV06324.1 HSP20-like protein [Burkholderia cenocepacia]